MTRQEFIDRTGFTPTEDHFRAIHEEYMAAGEGVDKDAFCKGWLEDGGPQRVYGWMRDQAIIAKCDLASVTEDKRMLVARVGDLEEEIHRREKETGLLEDRIRLLEAQKTAHEVREERMTAIHAGRADDSRRYRKALLIARLMLESLRMEADGEDLTMALDEIGDALASGDRHKEEQDI